MIGYTQGKWIYDPGDDGDDSVGLGPTPPFICAEIDDTDNFVPICTLDWPTRREDPDPDIEWDTGEREYGDIHANGHLLAASPNLLNVAEAYEAWEADLITSDESWAPNGMAELPRLTESQYRRLLEIQAMRNEAIAKAKGKTQ